MRYINLRFTYLLTFAGIFCLISASVAQTLVDADCCSHHNAEHPALGLLYSMKKKN